MTRLCFVCLGNICRSPMAECVVRALAEARGVGDRVHCESAGTAAYHVGDLPDRRTVAAAARHGVRVDGRGAHFTAARFDDFDLVLAMDRANLRDLQRVARGPTDLAKLRLFRSFDPRAPRDAEVDDPYYGDARGFEETYRVCRDAGEGLLDSLFPR